MEFVVHLRLVLFINCILELSTCPSDRCRRQPFYEFQDRSFPGDILLKEGPLPLYKCRRLCRQYLECWSFSFEWLSDDLGMCNIYSGVIHRASLVVKDHSTVYMPCPERFRFHVKVNKCYSSQVINSVTNPSAINMCRELHAGATPVEPRNRAEMDIIVQIANGRDIWLGMYRPRNSQILDDFKYCSDGSSITYRNWYVSDPNNEGNDEYCVGTSPSTNYQWYDYRCTNKQDLICEL